ncbi:MAG TPA: molecular chaperone TorD family protein [Gammaproteobacteria bacterium]|nr:molecular chaperone TorD family protein [Gammaproteobacteria bacterium]
MNTHNDKDEHSMTEAAADVGMEVSQGSATQSATGEDALRANAWSLLARLLATAPDESMLSLLAEIDAEKIDSDDLIGAAWRMLGTAAGRSSPAELMEEYHDLFIGVGRGELVPYGSWYMTGFLMEQPLARLRDELRFMGFERQEGVKEPEDHAAALCDVMAMINTGDEPVSLEAQAGFFSRHISPWLGRFFRDMQQAPSARFYRAVGQLGEQFIEVEKGYLKDFLAAQPAQQSLS